MEINWPTILTAIGGFLTTAGAAWLAYRTGKAKVRREELEIDQQGADWNITQARRLYVEARREIKNLSESERRCQVMLAVMTMRVRELESRSGIKHDDSEQEERRWLKDILGGKVQTDADKREGEVPGE